MQFRLGTATIVFLGSYMPLGVILLAQNVDYSKTGSAFCWQLAEAGCNLPLRNPTTALLVFAIPLVCFLLTILLMRMIESGKEIRIIEAKYIPADLMNYTLPYIVSFMSIDYQDVGKFIGLAVFLLWMFWISHKSGQIILNPVLIALGWRLYEIKYSFLGGQSGNDAAKEHLTRALVKGHLAPGEIHKKNSIQEIEIIKPAHAARAASDAGQ